MSLLKLGACKSFFENILKGMFYKGEVRCIGGFILDMGILKNGVIAKNLSGIVETFYEFRVV